MKIVGGLAIPAIFENLLLTIALEIDDDEVKKHGTRDQKIDFICDIILHKIKDEITIEFDIVGEDIFNIK